MSFNNPSSIKPGNKPINLSTNVNKITNHPNNLVNNKTKCHETLKVNSKPTKTITSQETITDNSEGKMACIIS